jgi:hypothetical protein
LRFEELGETSTGRILKFMTVERGNLIRILTCFDAPSNLKQLNLRTMVKLMSEPRILPAFASEKEEADWWYENREKHAEEFLQAAAEGRVRRGSPAVRQAVARNLNALHLDAETVNAAKQLAALRGMEVQNVLKLIVKEALERESHPR